MCLRFRMITLYSIVIIGVSLFSSEIHASVPIAQISNFEGEVTIQSDTRLLRVTRVGLVLNEGDMVQTKQGNVQITFNDGAIMKVSPFTNAMIQEREERGGWWIARTKKAVRRITCFVGKLWFKSGASKRKNHLQTPTAVCGLRGSEADIGFDNLNTYLNVYTGVADVVGRVIKGFFAEPGIEAATRSRVYNSLASAYQKAKQAEATGKRIDQAKAQVEVLKTIKAADDELQKNPDDIVAREAKKAAKKAEERLRQAGEELKKEKTVEAAAQEAEEAARKAEKAAEEARKAAEEVRRSCPD